MSLCECGCGKDAGAYVLDRKKENLLRTLGWTILRFTNKQALEETAECARKVKEEQGTVLNVKPTA